MKLILILLLLPMNLYANELLHVMKYGIPTERENGDKLNEDELAEIQLFEHSCDPPYEAIISQVTGTDHIKTILFKSYGPVPYYMTYWSDGKPITCVKAVAVDTDRRMSLLSELFVVPAVGSPNPVECIP